MDAAPDKQISLTNSDARSMATSGKGTGSSAAMSRPRSLSTLLRLPVPMAEGPGLLQKRRPILVTNRG